MIALVLKQFGQEDIKSVFCILYMHFWEKLKAFYSAVDQFTNLRSLEKLLLMIIPNFNIILDNF